jgi:hypothetical protein
MHRILPAVVALVAAIVVTGAPGVAAQSPAPTDRATLVASLLQEGDVPSYARSGDVEDLTTDDIPAFAAEGGIREVSGGWYDADRLSSIFDFRFQFPDEAAAAAFLDDAEDLLGEIQNGSERQDPPVTPLPDTRYFVYHDTLFGTGADGFAYLMHHGNIVAKVWVSGADGSVSADDAGAIALAAADRMRAALGDERPTPSASAGTAGTADPADVSELLSHIPAAVASDCVPDEAARAARFGEVARVVCTQSDVASIAFSLYDTTDSLDAAYDVAVAVAQALGWEAADSCEAGGYEGTWTMGDETAGQLLCVVQTGTSTIVWSYPVTRILSTIRETDGDPAAAWQLWLVAGPE